MLQKRDSEIVFMSGGNFIWMTIWQCTQKAQNKVYAIWTFLLLEMPFEEKLRYIKGNIYKSLLI